MEYDKSIYENQDEFIEKCDRKRYKSEKLYLSTQTKSLASYNDSLKSSNNLSSVYGTGSKCEQCDYTTKDNSNLKRHIKTQHNKTKDFICDDCDYATNRKDVL